MATIPGWTDGLPYALFRANQAVQRRLLDAISELGVTINQLGIAVHLDQLGGFSGADLARLLRITPQSAAVALAHLERIEWVRRGANPTNRRAVQFEITKLGSERAAEGRRLLALLQSELADSLGATQVEESIARLEEISAKLA